MSRKPYAAPTLTRYGAIAALTRSGGSLGVEGLSGMGMFALPGDGGMGMGMGLLGGL
ncbi:MAG: lasso RiPP family leader peptide-containing protein [Actinomycetota bacterium]|nr:lasso RiPP family leader peptide-containing protein [Actinomycetota bacterium]